LAKEWFVGTEILEDLLVAGARPGTIPKYTKRRVGAVGQVELDKGNGVDHGGGDINHDGEDHGDEEEGRAYVVNSFTDGHCE
jgi:hypothetical protein